LAENLKKEMLRLSDEWNDTAHKFGQEFWK
jgi:hypothetical protein